jgi:peptidoglycan/xylan/chitin deacetylase (PgdA/CDA1 family)
VWDPIDPKRFDAFISYASRTYTVLPIEELVEEKPWRHSGNHKRKWATLQFDHGYKDHLEYAAPVLEKYGLKASFYLVTESIESGVCPWPYHLGYLMYHSQKKSLALDFYFVPDSMKTYVLGSKSQRPARIRRMKEFIKTCNDSQSARILNSISTQLNDVALPENKMLAWREVAQLRTSGHRIGSQTHTHLLLGNASDESKVLDELQLSKNLIEYHLETPVVSLLYPSGSFNEASLRLVKMAGYKMALTLEPKSYNPVKHSDFSIPGMEMYNEPFLRTRLRLNTRFQIIKTLFGKI